MDTERRREELEKKRQKLAELRRAREERRTASTASVATSATSTAPSGLSTGTPSSSIDFAPGSGSVSVSAPIARRPDLDALVSSLLDRPASASSRSPALSTTTSEQQHSHIHHSPLSSIASSPIRPASAASESASASAHALGTTSATPLIQATTVAQLDNGVQSVPPAKPSLSLQPSDIVILDLPPVERVLYSKEMQTDDIEIQTQDDHDFPLHSRERAASASTNAAATSTSQIADLAQAETASAPAPVTLTEDDIRQLISSTEFSSFVDSSSRLMEKALTVAEQFDFLRDYTIDSERTGGETDLAPAKFVTTFNHDQFTKGRTISSLSWNPRFPELFAAAYTKSVLPTTESDGLVLVWNLLMPTRPEFVLTCQSEVRTIRFSDFHPHLIIGGTYSGQVALWDTRSKSRNPVLKTPLSASGHTHPVTCCALVGTEHAHQLLTSASDGTICTWQLDMLAQPQEILELNIPPAFALMSREASNSRSNLIAFPSVAASAPVKSDSLSRYDRATSKAGVVDHYAGHSAPHGLDNQVMADPEGRSRNRDGAHRAQHLHNLHPAVFASVDGSGHLDLWNLNQDTELYVSRIRVAHRALNKVSFSKDGRRLLVGSADGQVYQYDLADHFLPHDDDWIKFQQALVEMEALENERRSAHGSAAAW
ncbi:WD40-repeat-containing domain protein [Catenaria anguillulae PL171]|uniref:WD40-repeat-containing domain protein n=1 Tax=Catenaria anguillulae PL171 TaxID=765915 RepID=A0A1Y2H7H8_9FUNG|nr:WD40-repeat-containing domain protein [Catenaria anguillulae PL171]